MGCEQQHFCTVVAVGAGRLLSSSQCKDEVDTTILLNLTANNFHSSCSCSLLAYLQSYPYCSFSLFAQQANVGLRCGSGTYVGVRGSRYRVVAKQYFLY